MDPDENLKQQLAISVAIFNDENVSVEDVQKLADLVLSLDTWMKKGGFLPKRWNRIRR